LNFNRFAALYRRHFREHRRERMFPASTSFFLTFAVVRIGAHAGHAMSSDFKVLIAGVHVHHLVWGIVLLLVVGYATLLRLDQRDDGEAGRLGRWSAILYGVGAALTLDEFALWLHLDDVYWEREGRASIDAVVLFGALVSCGLWGGPFIRAVTRQMARLLRRYQPPLPDPLPEPPGEDGVLVPVIATVAEPLEGSPPGVSS